MNENNKNNVTLRDLQFSILDILNEVIKICEKNGIKYVAYGGTCLGAIRHSGFIPWDDDADIAMPRNDYNKFILLCKNGALPKGLVLQNLDENEPHYGDPWIRIRKQNTLCVIPYHKDAGWKELGVFLDIFPFDYVDCIEKKKLYKRQKKINSLSKAIRNKVALHHKTLKSKLFNIVLKPISLKRLLSKRNKLYSCHGTTNSKYVVDYNSAYGIDKGIFSASIFKENNIVKFETIEVNVSSEYDSILKTQYGEYMTLPPENKRVAHLPIEIKI